LIAFLAAMHLQAAIDNVIEYAEAVTGAAREDARGSEGPRASEHDS
jgi:hypothetical protein